MLLPCRGHMASQSDNIRGWDARTLASAIILLPMTIVLLELRSSTTAPETCKVSLPHIERDQTEGTVWHSQPCILEAMTYIVSQITVRARSPSPPRLFANSVQTLLPIPQSVPVQDKSLRVGAVHQV